jgi:hypothetical protein
MRHPSSFPIVEEEMAVLNRFLILLITPCQLIVALSHHPEDCQIGHIVE